jgi:hypothetical protein
MPKNYFSDVRRFRCIKQSFMSGFACCQNKNRCEVENCASCALGQCVDCATGYSLIVSKEGTKCVSKTAPTEPTCRDNQVERNVNGRIYCQDCMKGEVVDGKCVCEQDFIGEFCNINCRRSMCSGHGSCDVENRRCICDERYDGERCNIRADRELRCDNGIYNDIEEKCECNYGFTGRLCEEPVPCVNGEIIEGKCLCEDGFSGRDCSVRRPQPPAARQADEIIRNRTETRSRETMCRHGFNINGDCYCHLGWGGEACDELMCKHGLMNITSQECMCSRGWSGEKCDISCYSPCNNKGSICNDNRVCECRGHWSGEYCENRKIMNVTSVISISDFEVKINKELVREDKDVEMKLIECLDYSCIPFEINVKDLGLNKTTQRLLRGRGLVVNENELELTLDEGLVPVNKSVMVYEKDNMSNNRTFDTNVVNVDTTSDKSYLFSVVSRQEGTSTTTAPEDNVIPNSQPSVEPSVAPSATPSPSVSANNQGGLNDRTGGTSQDSGDVTNVDSNGGSTGSSSDNVETKDRFLTTAASTVGGVIALIGFGAAVHYLRTRGSNNEENKKENKQNKKKEIDQEQGHDTLNPLYKN